MSDTTGAADGELLEFLGSVDGEGEGWSDYLEDTDLSRVAAAPPPPPATPPRAAAPPAPPAAPPSRPAPPPARAPQPGSQP